MLFKGFFIIYAHQGMEGDSTGTHLGDWPQIAGNSALVYPARPYPLPAKPNADFPTAPAL
jgi:hypothetical protein